MEVRGSGRARVVSAALRSGGTSCAGEMSLLKSDSQILSPTSLVLMLYLPYEA